MARHLTRSGTLRRAAVLAAGIAGSMALFPISRGKWSDVIIDSGREWIVPDALAHGKMLYRDVVYWFGPFTPYFQSLFLRAFGSGFRALVLSGTVGAAAALAALSMAVRRVAGRDLAAACTFAAIPALVFLPNGGGPLLGMGYRIWHAATFTLLAIAVSSNPRPQGRLLRAAAAGVLAGLAGLCRTEWGLVAAACAGIPFLFAVSPPQRVAALCAALAGGFVATFAGVLGVMVARAGFDAVVSDGHVLLIGLPAETRGFLVAFSGIRDWPSGVVQLLYSAGMWTGLFLALRLAVAGSDRSRRSKRLGALIALLGALGVLALAGGASGAVLFSGAPAVCLGAAVVGMCRARRPRGAALAAFGIAGLLLSYRRPFHIGDSGYVGPPILFAFVAAAGLVHLAVAREGAAVTRRRLLAASAVAVLALGAASFAARAFLYASDERVPVEGTDGMLTARPERARALVAEAAAIRAGTPAGSGLVVFPEGEVLNLMTGRPNPIRHKLYLPGYLSSGNEAQILGELERAAPAAVVVRCRPTSEYGASAFGAGYGERIADWIRRDYGIDAAGACRRRSDALIGFRRGKTVGR